MSWFNFKFFDVKPIKGDLEKAQVTAACFGRTYLIVCVSGGKIYAYDRSSKTPVITFQGYNGTITNVKHLQTKNVVVTVGDDNEMPGVIRIWDMDRIGEDQRPQVREHRMFSPQYPPPQERVPMRLNYNSDMAKLLMFVKGASGEKVPLVEFMTIVVSFDVSEDLQHIVAGLANGEIFLMKGDIERSPTVKKKRYKSIKTRLPLSFVGFLRQKPIVSGDVGRAHVDPNGGGTAVSGQDGSSNEGYKKGMLHQFATSRFGVSGGNTFSHLIYVVYEDRVTLLRASAKGFDYNEFDCAPFGSNRECSCLSDRGLLAVAHNKSNRVFFFGGESKDTADLQHHWDENSAAVLSHHENPIEIEGDKRKVCFYKNYLVVLTQVESRKDKFLLQAFDYDHNLRALSEMQSNVAWVLPDVGQLLVISQARQESKSNNTQELSQQQVVQQKIYKFVEIELKMRLKQLFERECYDKAISMAKKVDGGNTHEEQTMIQLRYGDHLFKKGKYDEAIQQYKETIGSVEPSYVIRQFLDAQRIKYLTEYLKELHRKKHRIANKNHTTLLLNCYTKMDDRVNLKKFIEENTSFDAHNAIKVCRQAGYYQEALTLAKNYHEFNDYVKIQLENLNDADAAIQFITDANSSTGIKYLNVDNAESILRDHGKELLSRSPKVTTDVLKELCTHWKGGVRRTTMGESHRTNKSEVVNEKRATRANAYEFIRTFVDSPRWMLEFLEYVANSMEIGEDFTSDAPLELQAKQRSVYNTLIELYLTKEIKDSIKPVDVNNGSTLSGEPGSYKVSKYEDRLELALRVMEKYSDRFDSYHVLALVQQHKFDRGILFMLKKLGLYYEIFVHHAETFEDEKASINQRLEAKNALMRLCSRDEGNISSGMSNGSFASPSSVVSPARSRRGTFTNTSITSTTITPTGTTIETERELCISLLSILVRVHCKTLDVSADITDVLKHIQDKQLLPPVVVIEIMSSNPNLKLKAVRDYVVSTLKKDRESIMASQKILKENTDKAAKLSNEVRQLETTATIFQTSKCTGCQQQLDLPAVHFLCKHSYHKRCLNETNLTCNICIPETRRLVQMQKELEATIDAHDDFFNTISNSTDGFSAIAEHFSNSIFSAPRLKKEALLVSVDGNAFNPGVGDLDIDDVDGVPDPLAEGW